MTETKIDYSKMRLEDRPIEQIRKEALEALEAINMRAIENGTYLMTDEEIEEEIAAARKERYAREALERTFKEILSA
ncbi:MAG: hypothetical protein LBN97_05220 [Oscillospiraceae bacterium]|jgi:hypothetical protein|nr:hypothetical protein [Oscillospiraceae bacterium]